MWFAWHLVHGGVPLLPQAGQVILQPEQPQPLLQGAWGEEGRRGRRRGGGGGEEVRRGGGEKGRRWRRWRRSRRRPGRCSGSPSQMFRREISVLRRFLWAGFWIPMAVRSSGVILEGRLGLAKVPYVGYRMV